MAETTPYWAQSPERLFQTLGTGSKGLSQAEAKARLAQVGPNRLVSQRRSSGLGLLLGQFKSPLILILLFATGISAFLGEFTDALITFGIVLISTLLSFSQEYQASRAIDELRQRVKIRVQVMRDGTPQTVLAEAVVPGDVVLLSAGSLVPADGMVLRAKDCFVNQAVLTGETYPVEKTPGRVAAESGLSQRTNCLFMGTTLSSGTAQMVVVQTGVASAYGQIAGRLSLRPPETEFERGIRRFGSMLTQATLLLVLCVFAVNVLLEKPAIDSLLFSIALAVGMAPEMLPAIISITLSQGAHRMAKGGVIVKRLNAIENFGSMDVLCTDKTGTLTEGVVRLDGALDATGKPSERVKRLALINASLQSAYGNPLDQAILAQGPLDLPDVSKIEEIPYDFVRKRLSVVVRQAGQEPLLVCKGALNKVLEGCSWVRLDTLVALESEQARIQALYAGWSAEGFRVLGLASKPVEPGQTTFEPRDEQGMVLEGFLLFFDPPKPGAAQSIHDLARFGIEVKLITGDNELVARQIARSVGLEVAGVLTGARLQQMSNEALLHVAERTTVFAEVDPAQKEQIILALKKTGHGVGYMGDGINDAPALHAADVGISVDQAVDVAKEAADFVLLKQDLDVLRQGIELGRRTFANTLKYVFYTTSANFGNMFSMAGTSLFLPFLPLLPKQILLNNFLSDFPSMTIVTDHVDPELIDRPRRWDIGFIRNFMVVFGLISSLFDYLTFAVLLWVLKAGESEFRTAWFTESLLTELLITLVVRTERVPFFRSRPSRYLLGATLAVAAVAIGLPYLPLAGLIGFVPLPWPLLLSIVAITGLYVLATELAKGWFYRRSRW